MSFYFLDALKTCWTYFITVCLLDRICKRTDHHLTVSLSVCESHGKCHTQTREEHQEQHFVCHVSATEFFTTWRNFTFSASKWVSNKRYVVTWPEDREHLQWIKAIIVSNYHECRQTGNLKLKVWSLTLLGECSHQGGPAGGGVLPLFVFKELADEERKTDLT